MDNKFEIINENNEKQTYEILKTFNIDNDNYIVYTDNTLTDQGNLDIIINKYEINEYCEELVKYNSDINGIEVLTGILHGQTFQETLDYCLKLETEEYAKRLKKAQVKTYLLVRKSDNSVIGAVNIRWNHIGGMKKFDGNIGYGIKPTERRKGYSKVALYLSLLECKKLGINEVSLTCENSNIASNKTILSLGGILKLSEVDPSDQILTNVYTINTEKHIDNKNLQMTIMINIMLELGLDENNIVGKLTLKN